MRSTTFANTLIHHAVKDGSPITQLHLHKLMYIVQGYYLCRNPEKSLGDEMFQPWGLGPVVSEVYHHLKYFGSKPITNYCYEFDPNTFRYTANVVGWEDNAFHETLNEVWKKYRHLSVNDLIELTHKKGGGWDIARQGHSMYIKDKYIKKEFTAIIKQEKTNG